MAEDAIAQAPPEGFERAMRAEFGPLTRWVAEEFFSPVRCTPQTLATLKGLSDRGFVVHVMRTTAWINFLYLVWLMVRHGLPAVRAVVNLRPWFTRPWTKCDLHSDFATRFGQAAKQGTSGLIFLRESAFNSARGVETRHDPFPALVELAKKSERPVYLVPELFLWEKWQQKLTPSIFDRVFGSPEAPGFLHSLGAFYRNHKRAQFRVGEPIDLKHFVTENPDTPTEVLARKVRGALAHHLARETRAVHGPPRKAPERILDETMRDKVFQQALAEAAQEKNRSIESVQREARRNLRAIAAKYSPTVTALASKSLDSIFNRIYDGVEVDEAGLENAMKAASSAPVVFTPSHKSHVDYLVMSYVLFKRSYQVPLVAAGANLSFFPLGWVLRRAGGFFLRRSFRGDKVYTACFKAYLKKLVHDGVCHEFFPEGGRSRTGKLLQPKLGLFTWLVDAVLEGARSDLLFVPVAIDYEKVVEGSSYTHELKGGEKKPEDLKALLSAPKVLTERYGRIHLTFDGPISMMDVMKERGLDPSKPITDEEKKGLVRAIANRAMYGISRASTVTPHALLAAALLAHRLKGVSVREIVDRIQLLRRIAGDLGAPISKQLVDSPSSPIVLGPVQDAMRMFASEGFVRIAEARGEPIYQVEDERRLELSFYKNTLVNLMAGRTIVASALLASGHDAPVARVREKALFLSRLFKFELIFKAGQSFDSIFDETLTHLERLGLVLRDKDLVRPAPEAWAGPQLEFLADLVRDFLCAYRLTVREAEGLPAGGLERKDFYRRTLESGRAEFLAGTLLASEALSKLNLENAVQWLLDQQFLVDKDKKLSLGAKPLAELMNELRAFLPENR